MGDKQIYKETMAEWDDVFILYPQLRLPVVNDSEYYYDVTEAEDALGFFEDYLHHVEGSLAGEPFRPERWQQYVIKMVYGWKRKFDDLRKFREVFIFIPRKAGKSFLGAGFALYGLFADGEKGARVVSAAADRDQAALIFNVARQIVEENKELSDDCNTYRRTMAIPETAANYQVVSAEVRTKHGKNLSTIVVDEVHAQPNRELMDVLFTSVGSRLQPLKIMLTTAGFDRESICYEYYDYAKKVQEGIIEDEAFFPVIFELGEKDNWQDREVWEKCNPNLGVSVTWDYYEGEFKKAIERPSYENTFKRLSLNRWTEQETKWVPIELWDECGGEVDPKALVGEECFVGVDLASKVDLTAVVLIFPQEGSVKVLPFFWVPQENIPLRKKRDRVDYDVWVRQGFIEPVPGNVMNYDVVRAKINELHTKYNIRDIGFDPWNAQDLMTKLESDDFEVVQIPQTYNHLTDPTKELEALVLSKKLAHAGNPIMRWMFKNIAVMEDGNGNIKLSKKASKAKIDGQVALVNALNRWIAAKEEEVSVYKERGLKIIG